MNLKGDVKMKGKKWIVLIAVFILLLAVPVPTGKCGNGDAESYTALTYKIIDRERCSDDGRVYTETKVYPFPMNFMSADFLIASTAQAAFESEDTSPEESLPGEEEEVKNETVPEKPPVLKVLYDDNYITADPGRYCWTYIDSDGETRGICADALHPLQSRKFMKEISALSAKVTFIFENEPDSLTVCCWPENCWNKPDSRSEKIEVVNGEISLKKGGYIYQVTGGWNDGALENANASYSFYAVLK